MILCGGAKWTLSAMSVLIQVGISTSSPFLHEGFQKQRILADCHRLLMKSGSHGFISSYSASAVLGALYTLSFR
jgi:hypothetical protein